MSQTWQRLVTHESGPVFVAVLDQNGKQTCVENFIGNSKVIERCTCLFTYLMFWCPRSFITTFFSPIMVIFPGPQKESIIGRPEIGFQPYDGVFGLALVLAFCHHPHMVTNLQAWVTDPDSISLYISAKALCAPCTCRPACLEYDLPLPHPML